ncbi:MAG: DUF4340 domain-containing protein [Myxococcales bacterium]|nr:DUF4340 domain-containing protein [Myxococcota bacterium]MDW8281009.1 DUF4340 domain-containing protein [Myxococcales bacterium]
MKETRTPNLHRSRARRRIAGASTLTLHAVLALLALVAAYLTWTRDKTQVQQIDQVVALDAKKRDLVSVTHKDESRTVVVERKVDGSGEPYAWVTVTTRTKTLVTPGGSSPSGASTPGEHSASPASSSSTSPPSPADKDNKATAAPGKPASPATNKGGDKAAADKQGEQAPPSASAAPSQPAATPPPVHEVKETETVKSFRGSEQADKLLEAFAPLMALRALGTVDEAKAKELGLTESKKSLVVQYKNRTVQFVIGGTSYGTGDIYVRDDQGRVFLLSSRFSSDFDYAESRLMERRLHRFERPDISRVEVTVGGKKKVLVQQNRQDPINYYWAEEQTPTKRDDALRNWMDKVLRIAISDYVAKGEEPQLPPMSQAQGGPAYGEVLTMRFYDGRKPIGHAVFSRYPKGSTSEYYATTELTIGLVRLLSATAESAVQDAEKW